MTGAQDSAEWFKTTLYSIGDGIVATDSEGTILHLNPTAERLCGWSERDAVGRPVDEVLRFVVEAGGAVAENPVRSAIARGAITGFANHTLLIARDGTARPIADSASPIRDAVGNLAGIVLVIRDQTEERRVAKTLMESEECFRLLFERMSEGVALHEIVYDADERPVDYVIVAVNPAFERQTGIPGSAVLGRMASEAYGSPSPPYLDVYSRIAKTGVPEIFDTYFEPLHRHFRVSAYSPRAGQFATVFEDVTDWKAAERALSQSEARYRKLFEDADEGILLTDPRTGLLVDCNRAFLRLAGYRRAELTGRSRESVFPAAEDQPAKLRIGGKRGQEAHATLRTKTGETREVAVKEGMLKVGDHVVVQSFVRDVSYAVRAGRERETTLRLLQMLNDGNDPIKLIEAVTRFLREWTGCEAVAVRLQDGDDYPYFLTTGFPDEFVQLESPLCARLPDGGIVRDGDGSPVLDCMCGNVLCGRFDPELPFFTKSGSFWTNSTTELLASTTDEARQARTRNRCNGEGYESVALIRLGHGASALGLLQINDRAKGKFTPDVISFLERLADQIAVVLSQKMAVKALQESESRLRLAVDATHVGYFDWDCRTDRVHYSHEWKQQLGYEDDEISDSSGEWQDRLHPQDKKKALEQVRAYVQEPWPNFTSEYRLRHKDGSYRCLLAQAALLSGADGEPEHMIGCTIDITERKRMEQDMRDLNSALERRVHERTLALEAANSELQSFAYSISHDLRAPLRAIDGLAAIIAEDHGAALGSDGLALCKRINENSRKMGQLIDDLLAYSRLGRTDVHRCDIDMREMAQAVFSDLTGDSEAGRVTLTMEPLAKAYGDPALIHQVWVNLIGNALKFSSKREKAVIEIGGSTVLGEHIYYVRDNGAGFDMQYADKLFGVFQRLHGSSEFEGTGVGLAIVQRVIRRHGGRTWAVGEVDRGATVYFTLPVKR